MRLATFVLSLVLSAMLSGCAGLETKAAVDGETPTTKPVINAPTEDASCPPKDSTSLVRDLTRPWAERVYLLPDGTTCRPGVQQ